MKHIHRICTLLMAALLALSLCVTAFAAGTIDTSKKATLSLYKYDMTKAAASGTWTPESYVSTGESSTAVTDALQPYAIAGVEFSYLRVAGVTTYHKQETPGNYKVAMLYGFADGDCSTAVLSAIGLSGADAYSTDGGVSYYTSDTLNAALSSALTANATTVKNTLETALKTYGGTAMAETDATGHSEAANLDLGLYLAVETRVPENVTATVNPFFVSLPMTTVDGAGWNYDVTVYPKNETGNPTLEKTVRETVGDTGKSEAYAHTATASVGDHVEYQIISTLPSITSKATNLTQYTFMDTLSKGIRYTKNDVNIEFFKDAACNDKITSWDKASGKFTVTYDDTANTMTIAMSESGLAEMDTANTVYDAASLFDGYSACTMRITYGAVLTADAVLGDAGNHNTVVLEWKRTNTAYSDTLRDDCHIYTYGIDLTKKFSDEAGHFDKVKFLLQNETDNYYAIATLTDGVYHVTGHTASKAEATVFIPTATGHVNVAGLEDDTYAITETATDSGYVLLSSPIKVVITASESSECPTCHKKLLTATAAVNGDEVTMTGNSGIVPLNVVNNKGFTLPKTGSYGTWMFTAGGVLLLGAAGFIVLKSRKRKQ